MPRWWLIVLWLLVGCTAPPLKEGTTAQNDGEPVVIVLWEHGELLPRVLLAQEAEQDGEQLQQTILRQVTVRAPLQEGEMVLRAPRATVNEADGGTVHLSGPIHISGALEQQALMGRARRAEMTMRNAAMTLYAVEWIHGGQLVRIDTLTMRDQWRERIAERPRGQPAPALFTAAQVALPGDLAFPAFRRQ